MASATQVAIYVLDRLGSVSTMKLQKLVFYSQALSLVKRGSPLFSERIEAWANGPVVPELFNAHRGTFVISRGFLGSPDDLALLPWETEVIDHVVDRLGAMTGAALSELTHGEEPWQAARRGCAAAAPSHNEITQQSIRAFYGSPRCSNLAFAS